MHISPLPALCNVVKTLSFNSSLHFTIFQKGNGGVDTYSVGITITISCFWHFLTQFVHNCSYDNGCFSLRQIFRKFRSKSKWEGPFRFLPTGIFGITSAGGPLISVGMFRPKFAVPFLTNRFFALLKEFGKGIKRGMSHSYWLAWFN